MGTVAVAPAAPAAARRWRIRHLLLAAAAVALVGGLVYLGTWPPLATVMSGSMAPTIDTGDVVVLGSIAQPKVGDVVAVPVPDDARKRYGYPPEVIHRVIRIAGGRVQTKGDARRTADPFTVPERTIAARVVATVPAAGRVLTFLGSPLGLLWLAAGIVLLVGLPLFERRGVERAREREELASLHAELRTITAELAEQRRAREEAQPPPPPPPGPPLVVRRRGGLVREVQRRARMSRYH